MNKAPQLPDGEFATRYRKRFLYVFCMLYEGQTASQVENNPAQWVVVEFPQEITLREPYATSVAVTQGGGKVIESRGGVLKYGTVAGTTGYLRPQEKNAFPRTTEQSRSALVPTNDTELDKRLGYRSGFYAFHGLRYIFRQYAYERRRGRTDVFLHWFDFKNDDFWRIEPQDFTTRRSAKKPMSYDYNIAFTCIEPSEVLDDRLISRLAPSDKLPAQDLSTLISPPLEVSDTSALQMAKYKLNNQQATAQALARMNAQRLSGLAYLKHLAGAAQLQFQSCLRAMNNVVSFFEDIHSTFAALLEVPLVLLAQLDTFVDGLFQTFSLFSPLNVQRELNEWALETRVLADHLRAQFVGHHGSGVSESVQRFNERFAQSRMREGATTDLLREQPGSTGSPDVNPFLGKSGLGLVTDIKKLAATKQMRAMLILDGDTIYSVAQRLLGTVHRFVDLVILNNLEYPYIVADAAAKPSNTLAWGEYINIPDNTVTPGNAEEAASPVPTFSGVVTRTGLTTEVVDEAVTSGDLVGWRTDQWIGYTCTLRPGSLVNEEQRVVVGNTVDTLTVNRAWTVPPAEDDTFTLTLELFDSRRPTTPESRAFGKDLLLTFSGTGKTKVNIVLGANKDLAMVRGVENLMQSLYLRTQTPLGGHQFHPSFGVAAPIGRPWSDDVALLHTYFARRSFLLDPRVEKVRNMTLSYESGAVTFTAEIQPIQVRKTRQVKSTVR